jgi:hypothetical protein
LKQPFFAGLIIKGIDNICNYMEGKPKPEKEKPFEQSIPHKGNYFTYKQHLEWKERMFKDND